MNCKQIREEIDTASRRNPYSGAVASHLNGCPDCHRYSDETASLLGLLGAQPRVEVPTDFEFRLRARMARAQAATASDRPGFLWRIRPETFSWGQMVAAAAALALVVTVSTFYIDRNNHAPAPNDAVAAKNPVDQQSSGAAQAKAIGALTAVGSVGATPVKFMSRSVKVGLVSFQPEDQPETPADTAPPGDIAGIDDSTRLYNPETKRLLKDRSRFYGAENVSISLARPAGAALTF
ncbi:MAG TPA: hypothetical protein VFV58_31980 [Blastocatellia bacterium]|nr:hypothetical protein [Blastocatellia bacterium]